MTAWDRTAAWVRTEPWPGHDTTIPTPTPTERTFVVAAETRKVAVTR